MGIVLKEQTSYHWDCVEPSCHKKIANYSRSIAAGEAQEHLDMHVRSKAVGKTLAGKVAHRDDEEGCPGMPFIGHISGTIKWCKENGWTYFEFNGRVFPVWVDNMEQDELCLARDVPGLEDYR